MSSSCGMTMTGHGGANCVPQDSRVRQRALRKIAFSCSQPPVSIAFLKLDCISAETDDGFDRRRALVTRDVHDEPRVARKCWRQDLLEVGQKRRRRSGHQTRRCGAVRPVTRNAPRNPMVCQRRPACGRRNRTARGHAAIVVRHQISLPRAPDSPAARQTVRARRTSAHRVACTFFLNRKPSRLTCATAPRLRRAQDQRAIRPLADTRQLRELGVEDPRGQRVCSGRHLAGFASTLLQRSTHARLTEFFSASPRKRKLWQHPES